MAQGKLLVLLNLIVFVVTEVAFKNVISQGDNIFQRDLTTTNCSFDPFKRSMSCNDLGFQDVPQDLFPDMEDLDLSFNEIQYISNTSFIPYKRLKTLSLFENDIREIAVCSLYSMPELEHLDLGNNFYLQIITAELFRNSTKLAHLDLSRTALKLFPSNILAWLPKLQILDIGFTWISYLHISSCNPDSHDLDIYLENAHMIDEITNKTFRIDCEINSLYLEPSLDSFTVIDSNTVAAIRSNILSLTGTNLSPELWQQFFKGIGNSQVEELLLQDMQLKDTDLCYLTLLQNKSLQLLDLTYNDLEYPFHKEFLNNLPLLHTLVLDQCSILYIYPNDFTRMKELRVLYLNSNSIQRIGDTDSNATWDIDLHELHLDSNGMIELDENSFAGLVNLRILTLRGNILLRTLFISSYSDLKSLEYLDLRGCGRLNAMQVFVPNLQTFILSDCEDLLSLNYKDIATMFNHSKLIKTVSLANNDFSSLYIGETNVSLFQGVRTLTTLDLKKNPLRQLQMGLFADLLFLKELDLSQCQLVEIEYKAFKGLQHLQTLYLQNNTLHNLPPGVFQNTGQLATLYMDDNILTYFENDLFVNSSKLQNLTLSGNKFTRLNRSTFEPILLTLISIDISDNELICTCDLKWLPQWLTGSVKLLKENETRCSYASLKELRENPLMSFVPAELCGPNVPLYASVSFAVTWIAVLLIFAYRHRWFLNFKLFLLKLAVIGYQEIQDARPFNDFEFHFNVMFAEEDEAWVRDHLRPVLEEHLPEYNRNVYGDNNLPLGMHYCDAVHYVVDRSYKTIILVSRAAIQDNWFVIKFRTAADLVNDTQIENMMVIFLEDIPDDELPFLVRLYLSDRKPYLSWEDEDDEMFQEYFWQKLIKLLTINLRCNNVIPPE